MTPTPPTPSVLQLANLSLAAASLNAPLSASDCSDVSGPRYYRNAQPTPPAISHPVENTADINVALPHVSGPFDLNTAQQLFPFGFHEQVMPNSSNPIYEPSIGASLPMANDVYNMMTGATGAMNIELPTEVLRRDVTGIQDPTQLSMRPHPNVNSSQIPSLFYGREEIRLQVLRDRAGLEHQNVEEACLATIDLSSDADDIEVVHPAENLESTPKLTIVPGRDASLNGAPSRAASLTTKVRQSSEVVAKAKQLRLNGVKKVRSSKSNIPGISRYWTPSEHKLFLEALKKHGPRDLKAISAYVKSRNTTQCRTHEQKCFMRIMREAIRFTNVCQGLSPIGSTDISLHVQKDVYSVTQECGLALLATVTIELYREDDDEEE